jgi:Carboxypeptidase regulatory-like domain
MRVSFTRLCTVLLLFALSSSTAWAQSTAQLSGRVTDQSGAVLPGVEITATQTDTGIPRNTITNETGVYLLPNLALGPYRLEAMLPGFRSFAQTGIVLQVGSNPTVNVVLEVGQVTEQVEVKANAALVETRSVGVGQIIENQRILELPLNGRQATDLILLSGAAVSSEVSAPHRRMQGTVDINVAGGAAGTTLYVLDGALHIDPYGQDNLPIPFPDALQEFKVETSAVAASSGMYSGAWVNSVTKSGTNEFHGDLFEFVRNDAFNARNFFATKKGSLKRNQFGGTIGGPVINNKLFFFGGYQGTKLRADPFDYESFVPTPAMMAGDFTTFAGPECRSGGQVNLRAPFINNKIDPARFSKAAVKFTSYLPVPANECGRVLFGVRAAKDESQYVSRIDYQQSAKNSLFGRLVINTFYNPVPYTLDPNVLNSTYEGFKNLAQMYAIGDTYLFGPNTINSFRMGVNRTRIVRHLASYFTPAELGAKQYNYAYPEKNFKFTINGGFSAGASGGPVNTTTYHMGDDLNLIRGTHQFGLGATLAHWRDNLRSTDQSFGSYNINGSVTGLGLADFLVGEIRISQSPILESDNSETYFGTYFADTWRTTPRLTVNYGVRWEPRFPEVVRNGHIANFSMERALARQPSTVFYNAPFGLTYPGDPGFPGTSCRDSGICNGKGVKDQWGNIAPRLGFAWDPTGDGRMSIRSSYALGYDLIPGSLHTGDRTSPWKPSITLVNPVGGFDDPWRDYPGGQPFPTPTATSNDHDATFYPGGYYFFMDPNGKTTSRHSWNLSIQRQFGTDWIASATYIGSRTLHIWINTDRNPVIYLPGGPCTINGRTYNPCSSTSNRDERRLIPLYHPEVGGTPHLQLKSYEPGSSQRYNGMLLSLERRAASGITVMGNYTWSHCYGGTTGTYLNPFDRDFDNGNCDADRRHIFNMTVVAQTPQFANPTMRAVATGWRLSGIYKKQSGKWQTIVSGVDRLLDNSGSQRAQQILENPYGDRSSLTNYLNPKAFTLPAIGSYGNMSPNNIEGPGTFQFDLALSRTFRVRENQRLEFRAEAFNVTNTFRRFNLETNLGAARFGQIVSITEDARVQGNNTPSDPRIMQFALKFVF